MHSFWFLTSGMELRKLDGILPLYKPKGMTSHDCIDQLRKLTGQRKIGHTGTLDPGAEGVLPVCLGKATKVVQYMAEDVKAYKAEVTLGAATTTEDGYGDMIAEKVITSPLSPHDIAETLERFKGKIEQTPPMYSAVKVKGKRLYEYARQGVEVERPKRNITILELDLIEDSLQFTGERIRFSVHIRCSKGTYVRTLAVDIGRDLGFPAHMSALIRTESGVFSLDDCLTFAEIKEHARKETLAGHLFPLDRALSRLQSLTVNNSLAEKIKNGAVLPVPEEMEAERFTVYNEREELLAVYQHHPAKSGFMKPEKVFI